MGELTQFITKWSDRLRVYLAPHIWRPPGLMVVLVILACLFTPRTWFAEAITVGFAVVAFYVGTAAAHRRRPRARSFLGTLRFALLTGIAGICIGYSLLLSCIQLLTAPSAGLTILAILSGPALYRIASGRAPGLPLRRRARRRGAEALAQVDALHAYARAHGLTPLYVTNVYQHARRGTKAFVVTPGQPYNSARDAWFQGLRVAPGELIVVQAGRGYGHHHSRNVLFVNSIHARVAPGVVARSDAYQAAIRSSHASRP